MNANHDAYGSFGTVQLPRIFGRKAALADMRAAHAAGARPVTLVGPPGVGKTVLARAYAATNFPHAWVVDARSAASLEDLERAVVLALSGGGGVDDARRLLAERPEGLLVLDNLEQCLPAARELLSAWEEPFSNVALVVTSRERLGATRERVIELLPLALPETDAPPADLRANPALALFTERAASVGAPVSDEDLATAADIVRRLDGLPLAIELAAGRSGLLSPRALLKRLNKPLQVLRGGGRRPLTEAIEGSWDLLSDEEQRVLSACCVFPGHFDVEAAEAVAHSEVGEAALDGLQSLRDKSLLGRTDGGLLCVLLSVREFVALRRPPGDAVTRAHADWFLGRPRESAAARRGYRDLQLIVDRSIAGNQGARAASAVLALHACWQVDPAEQCAALGRVLARFESTLDDRTRVDLLLARAALLDFLGEPGAMEELDRAEASAASDPRGAARVATQRSGVLRRRGKLDAATTAAREALAAAPEDDGVARGEACIGLGFALHAAGDPAGALEAWSMAADGLEASGESRRGLDALVYAAVAAQGAQKRELGLRVSARGRGLAERLGDRGASGFLLAVEARFASRAGEHTAAESIYEDALAHVSDAGDPFRMADVLLRWAGDRIDRGDRDGARVLIGRVRELSGVASSRKLQDELTAAEQRLRAPVAPTGPVIRLDPERRRFRVEGEWVDLASRDLLWRLLERLVVGKEAGVLLPMDELVASMWPDENLIGNSGRDRIYNAVSTLRRLGLAGILRGSRAGYSLQADVRNEE